MNLNNQNPSVGQSALNAVATEAVVISEEKNVKRFIEANTQEATIHHLSTDCVCPVFSRDNELTISHPAFIETVYNITREFFPGEQISDPEIRVSHLTKGRIPEAMFKPQKDLLPTDETKYYDRMAFCIELPTIHDDIDGNKLTLSVGGVRSYNSTNLLSRKAPEKFKVFIGFKNMVCCNMCVWTDGYLNQLEVTNLDEMRQKVLEMLNNYNAERHLAIMRQLTGNYLTEHQFCQLLGRLRLFQCLPTRQQKALPRMIFPDTQVNAVAKSYIADPDFKNQESLLSMWNFFNLLTGANKSSYIDLFLDRAHNATELALGINSALQGDADSGYHWFLK